MVNSETKIALVKIKAQKQVDLKRIGTQKSRFSRLLRQPAVAPMLTKEQDMMQELFGGSPSWGSGEQLPKLNHALTSGNGLINSGDDERETGAMFGI